MTTMTQTEVSNIPLADRTHHLLVVSKAGIMVASFSLKITLHCGGWLTSRDNKIPEFLHISTFPDNRGSSYTVHYVSPNIMHGHHGYNLARHYIAVIVKLSIYISLYFQWHLNSWVTDCKRIFICQLFEEKTEKAENPAYLITTSFQKPCRTL